MKIALIALVAMAQVASAQPSAALGKPLPAPDLAAGTVVVRVLDGSIATPHAGMQVTLVAGGRTQAATTDDVGRAQFEHLAAGTKVKVRIATKPAIESEGFTVPDTGGTRILLSTRPLYQAARPTSGHAVPSEAIAPGAADVRLSYDNLDDPKPPSGVDVALVGYRADATVTVQHAKTDGKGIAHFTGLDTSSTVAYFALAQLPRRHAADRLAAEPVVPNASAGVSIMLSALQRTSTDAPVDDLLARQSAAAKVAAGKVSVHIDGPIDPHTKVELIDAASGNPVATGEYGDHDLVLAAPRSGAIVYAEALAHGDRFRSLPFEIVADRGAIANVYVFPRLLPTYQMEARADDHALSVGAWITIANNSFLPYAEGTHGPSIPLPSGATHVEVPDEDRELVRADHGQLEVLRPLPPGGVKLHVAFDLPATGGEVGWSLDLPYGAYESYFAVAKEPGLSIDHIPASSHLADQTDKHGSVWLEVDHITMIPKQAMTMTVHLPKPSRDNAVLHACRQLAPDPTSLVGKPVDFTLPTVDGKQLKLSSLRGKVVLVNLMASWVSISGPERPKLAALAKAVGTKLAVVMVASDKNAKDVTATVGSLPFPVVVDAPAKPDDNIGAVTSSWGVVAVPESLLVDRKGIVRFHFQNVRSWDEPAALRCINALVAE